MGIFLLCRSSESVKSLSPKNVIFELFSDMKQEKMAELPFNSLKGTRGGHFKLFVRPCNLKRLSSVCRFALIIGSKMTCFRPLFYFFRSKALFTKSTPRS